MVGYLTYPPGYRFSVAFRLGGFRFLGHPLPTQEFCFPYGWLTMVVVTTTDLNGVNTFHTGEMRLGWVSSILRGIWCPYLCGSRAHNLLPINAVSAAFGICIGDEASSRIHFHSPVQPSHSPVTSFG